MQDILNLIKDLNPEVLFIVVVSSSINSYLKLTRYKFLVHLVIAMGVTLVLGYDACVKDIFRQWFVYAGQSMILHEIFKNFILKKREQADVE